jgi:hypothetical protein
VDEIREAQKRRKEEMRGREREKRKEGRRDTRYL